MFTIQNKKTKKYIVRNFCTKTLTFSFVESLYESKAYLLLQHVEEFFQTNKKEDFEVFYEH